MNARGVRARKSPRTVVPECPHRVWALKPFFGGYAERVAVPPSSVVPTPDSLDDAEASALSANYLTSYFALAWRARLEPGETVVVLGSAGGVGTAAIQVAKALGARVIAVVHRPEASKFVSSLRADVVVPLTDGWAKRVQDHTDGRGADVVFDPVGGAYFDDAVRTLAIGARLLVIGFAGGSIPSIKVNRLLMRNAGVLGVGFGEYLTLRPEHQARIGAAVGDLVATGLRPPEPLRYALSDGRAAMERLASGGVFGKLVLET